MLDSFILAILILAYFGDKSKRANNLFGCSLAKLIYFEMYVYFKIT